MGYLRFRFELRAERQGELIAELWSLGCLGAETRELPREALTLDVWFSPREGLETEIASVGSALDGVRLLSTVSERERDWMAAYRAQVRPIPVGRYLLVDPREPNEEAGIEVRSGSRDGRHVLRIPARAAFGTGSHESTRLALELLEELPPIGLRVLDVGAGSGILGFAAELLGACFVVGVEVDLVAVLLAGQNRSLNGLFPSFVAGTLDVLSPEARGRRAPRFDLVLINVLPYRIREHLPRVPDLLAPGGRVVFSGISGDEGPDLLEELAALGLHPRATKSAGEWLAYLLVFEARGAPVEAPER